VHRTKLFGTDGIRGEANQYPMDGALAFSVGQALTYVLRKRNPQPKVIIGRDTRISGPMIESALAAGIMSMGATPLMVGVLPTPGIAFMTRSAQADAGIVISASHNPYQDNGIKIFSGDGFKLSDSDEETIEGLILDNNLKNKCSSASYVGRSSALGDAERRYADFLKGTFPRELSIKGMKIVLDAANGATYRVAPDVFNEMGVRVHVIHNQPDGININDHCGSQHTHDLEKEVAAKGADLGLAFDGDGDRLIAVDEKGQRLTGDQILVICAKVMKDLGSLKNNLLVTTVMSNLGLRIASKKYGFDHHASKVGDRHVLEEMRRLGGILGGEDSGHMIFLDHHTTGDGILAAIQLISAMVRVNKPLSELAGWMDIYPQKLINIKVKSKPEISTVPEIVEVIVQVEDDLGEHGRVLVRYSGTENLCRVMVEGPTEEITQKYCSKIAESVRLILG
jgi:phosphoglucosamine mutase